MLKKIKNKCFFIVCINNEWLLLEDKTVIFKSFSLGEVGEFLKSINKTYLEDK